MKVCDVPKAIVSVGVYKQQGGRRKGLAHGLLTISSAFFLFASHSAIAQLPPFPGYPPDDGHGTISVPGGGSSTTDSTGVPLPGDGEGGVGGEGGTSWSIQPYMLPGPKLSIPAITNNFLRFNLLECDTNTDYTVFCTFDLNPVIQWYSLGVLPAGQLSCLVSNTFSSNAFFRLSWATNAASVAAGDSCSFSLKSNGTIFDWGKNNYGQLGNGSWTNNYNAAIVPAINKVSQILASASTFYVLQRDGSLWSWGDNSTGGLGIGTSVSKTNIPVRIALTNVTGMAAGIYHVLTTTADGSVWSWGVNRGQLGNGNANLQTYRQPILVSGIDHVKALAAGNIHSLAIGSNGSVYAWGDNTAGQLGDGTTVAHYTPTLVTGITNAVQVQGSYMSSYALTAERTVWAWGINGYGQLGIGGISQQTRPVRVVGISNVIAIAANAQGTFCMALKDEGTVWSWGNNSYGQLGNGTFTATNLPSQIAGLSNIVCISAGNAHAMALQDNGMVWLWGLNSSGQVGNSNLAVNANRPIALDQDGDGLVDYNDPFPFEYYNSGMPSLTMVDGDNQFGVAPGNYLARPLTVLVQDSQGHALANAPVTFVVEESWADSVRISPSTNVASSTSCSVRSGPNGTACVFVALCSEAGLSNHVTALATNGTNSVAVDFVVNSFFDEGVSELPPMRLGYWSFNDLAWIGDAGQEPIVATNIMLMPGLFDNAVQINSSGSSLLRYRQVETNGLRNITFHQGTWRFWFQPDWTSSRLGGSGPGNLGSFISVPSDATHVCSLMVDAAGNNISLVTTNGNDAYTYVSIPISWISNQVHQIAITFGVDPRSYENVIHLYIDGEMADYCRRGLDYWPIVNCFDVGSDRFNHQVRGRIDELETYNYGIGSFQMRADYAAKVGLNLSMVSGNAQETTVLDSFLPSPLVVRVTDNSGQPLSNLPVKFTGPTGVRFAVTPEELLSAPLTTTTDADGYASVYVNLLSTAQATNFITVSAAKGTNIAVLNFTVIATYDECAGETIPSRLGHWNFNNADFAGEDGQLPTVVSNVGAVLSSLGGKAARFEEPCFLNYRHTETSGNRNIDLHQGTIRFWFSPNWSYFYMGKSEGPGRTVTFLSANENDSRTWSLTCGDVGNPFLFRASKDGQVYDYLSYGCAFNSNQWAQIALTYTATNSVLYVNGNAVCSGSGVAYWPDVDTFTVGSDNLNNTARATIDELETYNYALSADRIATDYATIVGPNGNPDNYCGGAVPVLTIVGGNNQVGTDPDVFLPYPLKVRLTDTNSNILSNAWVTFTAAQDGVRLAETTNDFPSTSVSVQTGADGHVSAYVFVRPTIAVTNFVLVQIYCGTNFAATNFTVKAQFENGIAQGTNTQLGYWKFDQGAFEGEEGQVPVIGGNCSLVSAVISNGVALSSTNACLRYNRVEATGRPNIALSAGTVEFWFSPSWASSSQGSGPTNGLEFISVKSSTNHTWTLGVDSPRNNIDFSAIHGTNKYTYLSAPISWVSNQFHHLVLTYTPTNSQLFIDGYLSVTGGGVMYWPNAAFVNVGCNAYGVLMSSRHSIAPLSQQILLRILHTLQEMMRTLTAYLIFMNYS